jgi:tRNA pseudouridine13 synthase
MIGRCLLLGDGRGALDLLLGQPDDQEAEPRRRGRAAYEAGDFPTALELCPKRLRFERQALDALRQGRTHDQAVQTIDRPQRELMLSAWQSALFNQILTRRLTEGTFNRLVPGDLALKHSNRSVFAVDEAIAEAENAPGARVERFEVSPSGPMWGHEMIRTTGEVDALELQVLEADGLTPDGLEPPAGLTLRGQRRPLRVPMTHADISSGVDDNGSYVRLAFDLPRGSFATIALRELMKN